jgi:hypothetical protein
LHSLEKLALFFADMRGERFGEGAQVRLIEAALGRTQTKAAEECVFADKVLYQTAQVREAASSGENYFLLGCKMDRNFLLEKLLNLSLPRFKINCAVLQRPI